VALFVTSWPKVKYAHGGGPIDEAFARALSSKPPRRAVELYGPGSPILALAALLRELQRRAGPGEYVRLDCRTAGRLLGVTHKTAWGWLAALVADGVLRAGAVGSRGARRASEFLYLGG
jgi:hypothetical protein